MSEVLDPALSDAKEWLTAIKDRRRFLLGEVGAIEQQLTRVGQNKRPATAELRRFWNRVQGCCPHCGRELMGGT